MRRIGWTVAVVAMVVAAYAPALHGGRLWDDDGHLTAPALRSWAGLARIWSEPGATQQYYPLLHTAFWLEHRLWGDAVLGYHLANLAQHLLAAGLFALVLRRLAVPGAGWAAAIFALHPVHVESVAWISEQKNTLSLVFYLGAALAFLRFADGRRRRDYWVGFALFGCALLTKTVTATLPAALLVVAWWQRGRWSWRREVGPLLPWLLVGAMAGLFTAGVERYLIGATTDLGGSERGLLAGRVVWFYLGNLVWPSGLTFIYPRWEIDPRALWQWAPCVGALAVGLGLWGTRGVSRAPLAVGLLFVGGLFPVLGFFDLFPFRYAYVADHFQYLANLAPIAAVGAALHYGVRRWPATGRTALGVLVISGLGLLTAQETPKYRSNETLYRATLAGNPESWMAHNNLALMLAARGERREALLHLRQAVRLEPDYFDGHNNLGLTLTQAGFARAALRHLEAAVRIEPHAGQAHNNLGIALAALRRPEAAVAAFRMATRLMPDSPSAQANLSKALRLAGRGAEADAAEARAAHLRGGR